MLVLTRLGEAIFNSRLSHNHNLVASFAPIGASMLIRLIAQFCKTGACLFLLITASLLTQPRFLLGEPRGEELVTRYLKESVRREAILTMEADYQEPEKGGVRLEFTWMRRVR